MGAMIREAPTPSPPSILAVTNIQKFAAKAEATAETANNRAASLSTGFLPRRSLNGPAPNMATVDAKVRDETDQPNCKLLSANSTSTKLTTPEITDVSKPIRKPPRATIRAT